ncbi:hypothetical protein ACTOB_005355 [Actinoplanes oblitus]|uniref:Uncharacterized protein n=1 Tax=Actinoplanes oblitus TaxID=3040509 RepID=A0ABY8W8K0_9ACTN|nr:hypothetical protein [Actinoplanes oblitus]WIM93378.1 hypothetical protein ACTOB_005355 [Actinoplanes oblitus]
MPLFGRRKPAAEPAPRQQTVDHRALDEAQDDFSARFRAWLESAAQAQLATGADALTDEIIGRVGEVPQPGGAAPLNRLQQISLRSFARTYATRLVENRRMTAIVAAADTEGDDPATGRLLDAAADFWDAVEAKVDQSLS